MQVKNAMHIKNSVKTGVAMPSKDDSLSNNSGETVKIATPTSENIQTKQYFNSILCFLSIVTIRKSNMTMIILINKRTSSSIVSFL